MFLLGLDLGSSAVKAALLNASTGRVLASAQSPAREMAINAPRPGWAEQDPAAWWEHTENAIRAVLAPIDAKQVRAIGISYQMHGLVTVDAKGEVVRPAIIWCDSRAVAIGAKAFAELGAEACLGHVLNSPGNFTASKLRWVQENEPAHFKRIHKIMLPGDYLALRLTGETLTTASGLSEGALWDFKQNAPADFLLKHWGIDPAILPRLTPTFGVQATLLPAVASALGLPADIPVAYRAGDQPNNAFSLNVLQPGDIAATGGTSGVVYGVTDKLACDLEQRVNSFAHVNHTAVDPRLGVLLCLNGAGILNAWLRRTLGEGMTYEKMNALAASVPAGSDGLTVLPFGNGSERMLGNRQVGARWLGLDFNRHQPGHLCRAAQDGIAFAFRYGIKGMEATGLVPKRIRAGNANLFLSPVFRETLASTLGVTIELVSTDGAAGAARAAGIGAGLFSSASEAFRGLEVLTTIEPNLALTAPCTEAYARWEQALTRAIA